MAFWPHGAQAKPNSIDDMRGRYAQVFARFGAAPPGLNIVPDKLGAMPGGLVALSPWADLALSGLSLLNNRKSDTVQDWESLFLCARHYLRKTNPGDPYASPVYASFAGFPPIMVHAGAHEILRDDASK